jgi:SSS family solute:Na+ symporter
VIAGLVIGCAVTILFNLVPSLQWQGIHPGIWGLLANVPVQVAVSLLTPPMDEAHVDQFVVQ